MPLFSKEFVDIYKGKDKTLLMFNTTFSFENPKYSCRNVKFNV